MNNENKKLDNLIAKAIHYPECWDTAAYPTLASALWEMAGLQETTCTTCKKVIRLKYIQK